MLGKLQMTEGATRPPPDDPGPAQSLERRPLDGLSSSGSGVATAAGLCFGSLGSDTGGSIRFPSATAT